MSNIIKSTRVRSQSILNLSDRVIPRIEENYEQEEGKQSDTVRESGLDLVAIKQKEKELKVLEESLQRKLEEIHMEAENILLEANEKAQKIEEEANHQKDQIITEAYQKQEAIQQQAEEEAKSIREAALNEKKILLESTESEVVEVIITLLQHIISEEVTGHVEWLKLVVRRLLLQEEISEDVRLLVSPGTMALLEKDREVLLASLSKLTAIEVKDTLKDTTCVLVTNQGNIEYDITEGLKTVIKELRILKDLT